MRRFRASRRQAPFAALVVLLPMIMTVPATAEPTQERPVPSDGAPAWTVTLLTGDVVQLTGAANQFVEVVEDVPPLGDVSLVKTDTDIYAVPGVAAGMLAADELDRELFNVSKLVRDGYADGETGRLPVIVTYDSGAQQRRATTASVPGGMSQRALPAARAQAVEVDKKRSTEFWTAVSEPDGKPVAGQRPLQAAPGIDKVWLDARVEANDDVSRVTIGADQAWEAGYQGDGQTVAVVDTGIDTTHPDLAGKVVAERSFVDGEGPEDGRGHGTHVASIIAGTGAASDGQYAGAAPGASLVNAKVLDSEGNGTWSDVIAGMQWAATKADVINMSLGGDPTDGTDPLSQALNQLSEDTGALFVVAAGNEGGRVPAPLSVGTPAAADEALAVAAASRDGSVTAYFSSVGPRRGDWALKPEISAPGAGIVAARASGTSMGSPVDDNYTRAGGTSMAAPHVAAAAAIVRQRHPDWTAEQVRDALTSTANPITADPVYWQGAGVVDVGAAVTQQVHADGILDLGIDEFPQAPGDTLSGTVSYTNDGDAPVTLDLSTQWWRADAEFGHGQAPWTPQDGSVTVSPATVTVPAHGSATATVTVDTGRVPTGSFHGRLTATGGEATVRTAIGFTRDTERYRLALDAVDRAGVPAQSTSWSLGLLVNLDTGEWSFVGWNGGKASFSGSVTGNRLLPGRYSFVGHVGDFGPPPYYPMTSWTMIAEPEIVLDRDRSFTFDARQARKIDLRTERPSVAPAFGERGDTWQIRSVQSGTIGFRPGIVSHGSAFTAPETYTLASRTTATTGTYRFQHNVHRVAPPVTLRFGRRTVQAHYPSVSYEHEGQLARFRSRQWSRLVDVGAGTAAEIERANVAGRFALLRPAAGWNGLLDEPATWLAEAGAKGIVVAPPVPILPYAAAFYDEELSGVPVAVVSHADGVWLRDLVADRPAPLTLRGAFPSPYSYDLMVHRDGELPSGLRHHPRDRELGQVTARYHGDTADEYFMVQHSPAGAYRVPYSSSQKHNQRISGGEADFVPGRFVRTEFYTPGVRWLRYAQSATSASQLTESNWGTQAGGAYSHFGGVSYRPGERVTYDIGSGPWVPGSRVPGDTSGHDRFLFSHNGRLHWLLSPFSTPWGGQLGITPYRDRYTWETRLDGTNRVISDTVVDPDSAVRLSTRTHTEWTVNFDPEVEHQPGVLVDWSVGAGLDNVVRSRHWVRVTPHYHRTYGASHGPFTVRLLATYDDGATWVPIGTDRGVGAGEPARFLVHAPWPSRTNGFVGYRVVATDSDGNAIDQTVIRAARTRPADHG